MNNSIKISISILCADFARLADEVRKIEKSGADMIHVDVMDGHFVPPVTIGPLILKALRPLTTLPIDAHLMVEHPETMLNDFAAAGADIITVHAECYGRLKPEAAGFGNFPKEIAEIHGSKAKEDIAMIRSLGKKVFMALNPGTEVSLLDPLLPYLDGVLVMSVNPGFSHQKFMPAALSKIQYLSRFFKGEIAVDGGINDITGLEAVKAGATILATASHFFSCQNQSVCVQQLKTGNG
ncbi:MAG: ribulose-phosphate 3-epimerase [Candidatus Omnitrophota bacterium]